MSNKNVDVANTVFTNAAVYTVDKKKSWAEAVAIADNKIIYVGNNEGVKAYIGENTTVHNLKGKMILPGFIDAHSHAALSSLEELYCVNLSKADSLEDYISEIKAFHKKNPDAEVISGYGWSNTCFSEAGPSKEILDKITTDVPIVLDSIDHHSIWANSKAMELVGINANTPDVEGGVIERDAQTKEPTGTFRESAMMLLEPVKPEFSIEESMAGVKYIQKYMASFGITTIHDAIIEEDSNLFKALNRLDETEELDIRFRGSFRTYPENQNDVEKYIDRYDENSKDSKGGLFEINSVKLFIDGVIEGETAYLKEPYSHRPDYRGEILWEQDVMNEFCAKVDKKGLQLHMHTIGDAAVESALDTVEYIKKINGERDNRPVLAHVQILDDADVPRMADLGVVVSPNPYWFVKEEGYYYDLELPYLGEKRASKEYPMKKMINGGIVMASGSDFSVTDPPDPLEGIQLGVTRCMPDLDFNNEDNVLVPEERATVAEMIESFTINGAYANYIEDITGSIEVGKMADIVVIDKNIFEVSVDEIYKARVLLTMVEGKEVYRNPTF